MKLMAATGVALGAAGPLSRTMAFARSGGKEDIGLCKSVKITCISETSWFDGNVLMKNMKDAGGPKANQWIVDWDQKNSGVTPASSRSKASTAAVTGSSSTRAGTTRSWIRPLNGKASAAC